MVPMAGPIVSGGLTNRFSPKLSEESIDQVAESRIRLLDLSVARVDNVRRDGARHDKTAEDFCAEYQVCFPYRGVFVWHVGNDDIVGDPNQVVFVRGGESYRISGPVSGGYAELIVAPHINVLSEIARVNRNELFDHPLFRRRYWRASPSLQSFRVCFLHWASGTPDIDCLEAEESVVALLRAALHIGGPRVVPCGPTTARLVRRTKEFLEAELSNRILLTDVGRAVGASPAYLTDVFRRVEGTSLHQYLTQLRLARALLEVPHTDDLTMLALETGFSSHSHFSAAFRRAFGCTPSQFRQTTRSRLHSALAEEASH
jgi:AraC family transcriptional regulator